MHNCATKQPTIAAAVERAIKYKAGSLIERGIDACIIKLVTTDLQPVTVVENRGSEQVVNRGFRELLRSSSGSSDSRSST